jgi:hypothetical protein
MPDDIIKQILNDMDQQGFPLEVQVTEILKTHDWEVYSQQAYLDVETGKQRTIDIESVKTIDLPKEEWVFQVRLMIECKKCIKPWVFYISDTNKEKITIQLGIDAQIHTDQMSQLECPSNFDKTKDKIKDAENQYLFKRELAKPIFSKLAYLTYEPFTNGKGKSIHRAQKQVIGAIIDLNRKLRQDKNRELLHCIFLKPVIILDGQLYAYQNMNLIKEKGLYYSVNFNDSRFTIEVITADYLETYLKGINKELNDLQRLFETIDQRAHQQPNSKEEP